MTLPDPVATTSRPSLRHPSVLLATWFGLGLLKPAPGTWGTVGALPLGCLMLYHGGWSELFLGVIVVLYVGLWAARRYQKMTRTHDASEIVIDEVTGMWIALLPCLLVPVHIILAFALFRLFDIWKPGPVGWVDKRVRGPMGVMMDDVIAGIFAALVIAGLRYANLI